MTIFIDIISVGIYVFIHCSIMSILFFREWR